MTARAARTLQLDAEHPAPADLAAAAVMLRGGGLVAFPTETFYGLGVDAFQAEAVARVFRAKGRPADKPLLVLVDSLEMAARVVASIPELARRLIARYWPGALTLIMPARPEVPAALTAGTGSVGVRIPGHTLARALVTAAGQPITAPSANRHGAPPPCTANEVVAGLGDRVDLVLDGGPTPGGPPSTVLDLSAGPPRVLRAGAVTLSREDLAAS
jgi:L-threonylcarbamoyladenylate synthase